MKFFHLSDLHIGKHLHFYNLVDLQRDIFTQIVEHAKSLRPDAILISGDIYDKSVPSGEAYTLFDYFLNLLSDIRPQIPVLIIAGNHDSGERLNYASTFLEKHGIFLSVSAPRDEKETLKKVVLTDAYGDVHFYLLPFIKPGVVRHLFPEGAITSYDGAVRAVLEREQIDYNKRNVLLTHQFYVNGSTQPETSESEQSFISVGGLDSVDVSMIERFDYGALGHIHKPQFVGKPHIRYCGTPLKYSVSEEKHEKSLSVITLGAKGEAPLIETIPLTAKLNVRQEKGLLSEILSRATEANRHDYIRVILTDETDPYKPKDQLEEVYDHILELKVDNNRTRHALEGNSGEAINLEPLAAFSAFYEEIQRAPMSEEELNLITDILNSIQEEHSHETN